MKQYLKYIPLFATLLCLLASCASIGSPDGGEYDETPPKLVKCSPSINAINSQHKKIVLSFDEFVKIQNANEKVVISPPQIEMPVIKENGKSIAVTLIDSLKPNTTYTIDFGDAIVDNNEGNPLGNFTYTFSTGTDIDTMEIAGTVLDASNLEPIKGLLVGLHSDLSDSAFTRLPFDRVSHTDSRGHFVIKGIKNGKYRVYALKDADNNFCFSQKSEQIAYLDKIFETTCKPDVRNDTVWRDSTHIDSIRYTPYTHYYPDDIVLRAFTEVQNFQYLKKSERDIPNRFSVYFGAPSATLPRIKGLNFKEKDAFLVENSQHNDTLTYWIRDTLISNIDTLRMQISYLASDSTGHLINRMDTLDLASKVTRAKLDKEYKKKLDDWEKEQRKILKQKDDKNGVIPPMPPEPLEMITKGTGSSAPDKNVIFDFKEPLLSIDSTKIILKVKVDSTFKAEPYLFLPVDNRLREYCLYAVWKPNHDYELEIDTAAFVSIYGHANEPRKMNIKIPGEDAFSKLYMTVITPDSNVIVQLLDGSDKVVNSVEANKEGMAVFYYIKPAKYYVRCFIDSNGDGIWTTGNFTTHTLPESVYYYSQPLDLKAGWEIRQTWNIADTPVEKQKPLAITKQKAEAEKKIKSRNAERLKEKNRN